MHARFAILGITSLLWCDALGVPLFTTLQSSLACIASAELLRLAFETHQAQRQARLAPPEEADDDGSVAATADRRVYPGGAFDVFGVCSRSRRIEDTPALDVYAPWVLGGFLLGVKGWLVGPLGVAQPFRLKSAEIGVGRLAMCAAQHSLRAPACPLAGEIARRID